MNDWYTCATGGGRFAERIKRSLNLGMTLMLSRLPRTKGASMLKVPPQGHCSDSRLRTGKKIALLVVSMLVHLITTCGPALGSTWTDPGPYHIGNSGAGCGGTPDGLEVSVTFDVGTSVPNVGTIEFYAAQSEIISSVYLNGLRVGNMPKTPGAGVCSGQTLVSFSADGYFRSGTNTLTFKSGGPVNNDYDDFFVNNITVTYAAAGQSYSGIVVPGDAGWVSTGISITAGDFLSVSATGLICQGWTPSGCAAPSAWETPSSNSGSGGVCASAPLHGLSARIGGGACFSVGSSFSGVADNSGTLELVFNDEPGSFGNNAGEFIANVQVLATAPNQPYISRVSSADASYRNGVESALIEVQVSNPGGQSASCSVELFLRGVSAEWALGVQNLNVGAGSAAQTTYSFPVPPNYAPDGFQYVALLSQSALQIDSQTGFSFVGTPLADSEINQQVADLSNCDIFGEAPVGQALEVGGAYLTLAHAGALAHIASGVGSSISIATSICYADQYNEVEDYCKRNTAIVVAVVGTLLLGGAILASGGTVLGAIAIGSGVLAFVTGAGTVAERDLIGEFVCGSSSPGILELAGDGTGSESMIGGISALSDSVGATYILHAAIEGNVELLMDLPLGWASADTVSIDDAIVTSVVQDSLSWAYLGPKATNLASGFDTTSVASTESLYPFKLFIFPRSSGEVHIDLAARSISLDLDATFAFEPVVATTSTKMMLYRMSEAFPYYLYIDNDGDGNYEEIRAHIGSTVAVPETNLSPPLAISPNPLAGDSWVSFNQEEQGKTSVSVFDINGRKVKELYNGMRARGPQRVQWDGRDEAGSPVAGGIYFILVEAPNQIFRGKLTVTH